MEWIDTTWKPLLGYKPTLVRLTKGWVGIICNKPEDTNLLLAHKWTLGGSNLMLKWWRLEFNPDTEYFQFYHIWVFLPGLPLQF
jgi:hypothetical protein